MAQGRGSFWHALRRLTLAFVLAATTLLPATSPVSAASGDRTLYLYYTHTGETARITFKRNGRYDRAGLAQLDKFLRDWRRNESIKMDPALFDLVWEVYQEVGASKPIHVVSAYRAPATNEMLRSRSRAVAKNSRHTKGMALDFFIPGVPVSKLRTAAMHRQVGGVGYYPASGSPFVHLDTGNVRAWPRMTRAQLKKLFPDGRTLHLPNDGVPLSKEGRAYATAQWQKCHQVPCSGTSRRTTASRSGGNDDDGTPKRTLMDLFFGDRTPEPPATAAPAAGPTQRRVASVPVTAPVPMARPDILDTPETLLVAAVAPVPASRPGALQITAAPLATEIDQTLPAPRVLLTAARTPVMASAYAPSSIPEPNAQRALQMLIEQRNTDIAQAPRLDTMPSGAGQFPLARLDPIQTASLSPAIDLDKLAGLIDKTWSRITATPQISLRSLALDGRTGRLVAPDLGHIVEVFVDASAMSSGRYAVMFEPDTADFDPSVELGWQAVKLAFATGPIAAPEPDRFTTGAALLIAQR